MLGLSRIVVTEGVPGDLVRELGFLYRGALYSSVAARGVPGDRRSLCIPVPGRLTGILEVEGRPYYKKAQIGAPR